VNLDQGTLRRGGFPVRIQRQTFLALASLLERPGDIVTREELCGRLWPTDDRARRGRNLNTALRKLRRVLGDSSARPRYVETVRGRGYRFRTPVEKGPSPRDTRPRARSFLEAPSASVWRAYLILSILAVVGALALGFCRGLG
jgi:DNA-binding winged helix-turn-helix (wHTH) protein